MTFDEFVNEIMEYESDTFSAKGFAISKEEATKVAEMCLSRFFEKGRIDGVMLDYFLYELRDQEENVDVRTVKRSD